MTYTIEDNWDLVRGRLCRAATAPLTHEQRRALIEAPILIRTIGNNRAWAGTCTVQQSGPFVNRVMTTRSTYANSDSLLYERNDNNY